MPANAGSGTWLATLAALAMWVGLAQYLESRVDDRAVVLVPVQPGQGWIETSAPIAAWTPEFVGHRGASTQTFENGPTRVGIHLVYYRAQDEAHNLVSSGNVLASSGNPHWRVSAQGRIGLPWLTGALEFRRTELVGAAERLLVADAFWIDGRMTTSATYAKLLLALAKLQGRGDDAALIAIVTARREPDRDAETLRQFAEQHATAIDAALRATRSRAQQP